MCYHFGLIVKWWCISFWRVMNMGKIAQYFRHKRAHRMTQYIHVRVATITPWSWYALIGYVQVCPLWIPYCLASVWAHLGMTLDTWYTSMSMGENTSEKPWKSWISTLDALYFYNGSINTLSTSYYVWKSCALVGTCIIMHIFWQCPFYGCKTQGV